jgi:hypothetical protein
MDTVGSWERVEALIACAMRDTSALMGIGFLAFLQIPVKEIRGVIRKRETRMTRP